MSLGSAAKNLSLQGNILYADCFIDINKKEAGTVSSSFDLSTKVRVHGARLRWDGDSNVQPKSYDKLDGTTLRAIVRTLNTDGDIRPTIDLKRYLCVENSNLRSLTIQERLLNVLKQLRDDRRIVVKMWSKEGTTKWYADLGPGIGDLLFHETSSEAAKESFNNALNDHYLDLVLVNQTRIQEISCESTLEALFQLEDLLTRTCADAGKGGKTKSVGGVQEPLFAVVSDQWDVGEVLTYGFLSGTQRQHNKVHKVIVEWTYYANVSFKYLEITPTGESPKIRISFDPRAGSWSTVGRDAQKVPLNQATMNLGWIANDDRLTNIESGTILHEFGHALGMMHEHQSPGRDITFDEGKVYDYYGRTQGWDNALIKQQILDKYLTANVSNFSKFDPYSIMMYAMPGELNAEGVEVTTNNVLSPIDKAFMILNYPYDVPHEKAAEWTFEKALDVAAIPQANRQPLIDAKMARQWQGLRFKLRDATVDTLKSYAIKQHSISPMRLPVSPSVTPKAEVEKAVVATFARALAKLESSSETPGGYTLPKHVQHGIFGSLVSGLGNLVKNPAVLQVVQGIGAQVVQTVVSKASDLLSPQVQHSLQMTINAELEDLGKHPAVHTILHGIADGAVGLADNFSVLPPPPGVAHGLRSEDDPRVQRALESAIAALPKLAEPAGSNPEKQFAPSTPAEVAIRNLLAMSAVQNAFQTIAEQACEAISDVVSDNESLEPRIKAAFSDLGDNVDIVNALVSIASKSIDASQPLPTVKPFELDPFVPTPVLPAHVQHGLGSSIFSALTKIGSNPLVKEAMKGVGTIVLNKVFDKFAAKGEPLPPQAQHALRLSMTSALLDVSNDARVQDGLRSIGTEAANRAIQPVKVGHMPSPMHGLFSSIATQLKTAIRSPIVKGVLTDLAMSTVNKIVGNYSADKIPPHVEYTLRTSLDTTLTELTENPAVLEAIDGLSSVYVQGVLAKDEAERQASQTGQTGAKVEHSIIGALSVATTVGQMLYEIPAVKGGIGQLADFATKKIFGGLFHGLAPVDVEVQQAIRIQLTNELETAVVKALSGPPAA